MNKPLLLGCDLLGEVDRLLAAAAGDDAKARAPGRNASVEDINALTKTHEKPSERKTREKAEAIRRARKAARKLAQREGLLPMPKRRDAVLRRAPPRF